MGVYNNNITVTNNLINAPYPITMRGTDGLDFYNNTFYGSRGVNMASGSYTIDNMYNNIIEDLSVGTNVTVTNHDNNIFGNDPSSGSTFVIAANEEVDYTVDNLFVDANSDFNLPAGSYAINFGDANYGPTTDILGNPRVGKPDAGCYEYVAADANQRYLTTSSTAGGSVTTPGEAGPYTYNLGTDANLVATADTGYHFFNWTGDISTVNDPCLANTTITMDSNYTVVANFAIDQHTLDVSSTAGGSVTTPAQAQSTHDYNEVVAIVAAADLNYHFVNWTGTAVDANKVANPSAASTTVTMDDNYTATANFALDQHTLTTSSTNNGSVTDPGEGPYPYNHGTVVPIEATADAHYHFVNWTGSGVTAGKVADPNDESTTITMDDNYTAVANFAIDQHNLTTSSTTDPPGAGGSVTIPGEPGPYQYAYGTDASIVATANANYHFVNWTGGGVTAGKVADPNAASTTITMDDDYDVEANFTIDQRTLTASSTSGGSVTDPGEGPSSYDHGTMGVSIGATAEPNYHFVNWTGTAVDAGKVANTTAESTTITIMDADYTLVANFTEDDLTAPSVTNLSPDANAALVPLNCLIILHIVDAGDGVDANLVTITVDGNTVYTGNVPNYDSNDGHCGRAGTKADYTFIYQPNDIFDFEQTVNVTVDAEDLAENTMSTYSYSFTTEMHSFGKNKKVNSGSDSLIKGGPATVRDSSGDIWAAWHTGPAGSRDIYVGRLTAGAANFSDSFQLTDNAAD
ncbi:MAG: InlB B-repeat-containing protein, partial [Planctomycetota bacterium]